jgi:DNA polymerase I
MNQIDFSKYREVWFIDFEFGGGPGERPDPVCLVGHELHSGKIIRLFKDDLLKLKNPPYAIDEAVLVIAYFSTAELNCHLALGWKPPVNVLDLYVEFKNLTNGRKLKHGAGLLGALAYHGLDCISAAEKNEMRELAMRQGPWSKEEKIALLNYCETDVVGLAKLLPKMAPRLDLPRALLRGNFMKVVAEMEHRGIPVDKDALTTLNENWESIKDQLIKEIGSQYGVYEGQSFRRHLFERYLAEAKILWPRLESGELDLSDDAFKEAAKSHPRMSLLRELRSSLSKMRLSEIPVGKDGRNRTLLSPFSSRTGRSQPSNNKFIFGPSVWLRSLIRPGPGYGLAYIDWSQQEFGIAAALSGDLKMLEAYSSGDPYLAFAKQAGAAPPEATKKSHEAIRDQYKACVLAVQYGMAEESLAAKIGQPVIVARQLLRMHRETYPKFWSWSDSVVDQAMLFGSLPSAFGWTIHAGSDANPRFLRNFPMQGNGAEMLRLACAFAYERGVKICATVHDAILIEAPLDELESAIKIAQEAMADASAIVLNGFRLNSDVKIIRYPDRYSDKRGVEMWNRVWGLIGKPEYLLE